MGNSSPFGDSNPLSMYDHEYPHVVKVVLHNKLLILISLYALSHSVSKVKLDDVHMNIKSIKECCFPVYASML